MVPDHVITIIANHCVHTRFCLQTVLLTSAVTELQTGRGTLTEALFAFSKYLFSIFLFFIYPVVADYILTLCPEFGHYLFVVCHFRVFTLGVPIIQLHKNTGKAAP